MHVDRSQFLKDGYVIFRECIPPEILETLRNQFNILVERQKAIWAKEAQTEDLVGGQWETSAQPRLWYDQVTDRETEATVDFILHENTMGISRRLMRCEDAAPLCFFLMCSPVKDHGPSAWHRDLHPIDQAPLTGLQGDLIDNGPGNIQWNVPLYDDDVLWVVPGSHCRTNTVADNQQFGTDRSVPLPDSIPVALEAGDAVAYTNTILHWGSNYSAKLRRTIHFGHRAFGGDMYPYVPHYYWDPGLLELVSPQAQVHLRRFLELQEREINTVVSLFQALVNRDVSQFHKALASLHPGEKHRLVCLIQLSKLSYLLRFRPNDYGFDLQQAHLVDERLSDGEIELLWDRFAPLDEKLRTEKDQFTAGFQSRPMKYHFEEMPENFDVDEFVATWAV